jgi:hypothetical protein
MGPKRAPGRNVTPLSKGTPTTATSQRPTSSRPGRRAKVEGPAKRGTTRGSTGPRGLESLGSLMGPPKLNQKRTASPAVSWKNVGLKSTGSSCPAISSTTVSPSTGREGSISGTPHERVWRLKWK